MTEHHFELSTEVPTSAEQLFVWHDRPGAFERLCPPFDPARVIERTGGIRDGDRATVGVKLGPIPIKWVAEHQDWIYGQQFRDVQISGPFAAWEHTHRFEKLASNRSRLTDSIRYRLPLGPVGSLFGAGLVRRKLTSNFNWRHRVTLEDLRLHGALAPGLAAQRMERMRVLVSGASGLVGRNLCALLSTGGHEVVRLVRRPSRDHQREVAWNPEGASANQERLEGFDAVVHLAGEPIAQRWSARTKQAIERSRVEGTARLVEALVKLKRRPRVLISASAIGYYGERGDEELDERSQRGSGFLPELAEHWERAAALAHDAGMRVAHPRFGLILSPLGGALAKMLPTARLGLGGPLGSGRHWWSWVSLEDATAALAFALATPSLAGPFNVVAPEPVTQAEFAKTLGRVLRRPAFLPVPALALRALYGEMADAALLSSTRVRPARLLNFGFEFRDPHLEMALRHQLGRWQ